MDFEPMALRMGRETPFPIAEWTRVIQRLRERTFMNDHEIAAALQVVAQLAIVQGKSPTERVEELIDSLDPMLLRTI